jgi:hypothetical protein
MVTAIVFFSIVNNTLKFEEYISNLQFNLKTFFLLNRELFTCAIIVLRATQGQTGKKKRETKVE